MKLVVALLVVGGAVGGVVGGAAAVSPMGDSTECNCPEGKYRSIWCVPHRVGYVAAVEIRSKVLFEALDAHGHEIDLDSLECAACRFALEHDAFCGDNRMGFVDRKAYFSKLSWLLAKGEPVNPDAPACAVCSADTRPKELPLTGDGWCNACEAGVIGNVRYRDRARFRQTRREYERLLQAVERSRECELCAAAIISDRRCPTCRISYQNGKPVTDTSPTAPEP